MELRKLTIARNTCWCELCKKTIKKGEHYLIIYKDVWKAVTLARTNICILCIERLYNQIDEEELKKLKMELVENKL